VTRLRVTYRSADGVETVVVMAASLVSDVMQDIGDLEDGIVGDSISVDVVGGDVPFSEGYADDEGDDEDVS
jgi:putative N-acetylmannosamine-6-phosphate epimerase